ncbi:YqaJ viral recombinase family nuclease [Paraburkholderia sp. HD33-4]|uniref:YqaJ viral recombinase family nuclease n=1 Tax=Paraburkholderia sp. HD33-4 TaxID=2883242 RepID=UPI001F2210F3|nr:YqaJ viral recombinase family protein [Paraburkholderia sp. HD33-4]
MNERQQYVGGSDAAAACGQSRFKTAYQLGLEKLGLLDPESLFDDTARERMAFGQAIEPVIADMFAERYRVKLRRHHQLAHDATHPQLCAHYDRTLIGRPEGFEAKNVDSMAFRLGEWGEPGTDMVPTEYYLQCVHYLMVSGYERWHLGACVGGSRLVCYVIERDEEAIDLLREGELDFWHHIERGTPPPLDYQHPTALGLMKRLYRNTNGQTVNLPPEAEALHYARLDFDEHAKLMEKGSDAAKARLMDMMGDASIGLLPNGGAYRRKLVKRGGYVVEDTTYVDFRYSKKGGGNE